jgi:hypothetical protein
MQMDKFTKRDDSGNVDIAVSVQAYEDALTAWVNDKDTISDSVSTAVEAVLDMYPGKRIPMPALLSAAVMKLDAAPDQHAALSKQCHTYVTQQAAAGNIFIVKGAGGGVGRDAPVKKAPKNA